MSSHVSFHISHDKAIEAIVWLAKNKPGIDIYHVSKILFYADKLHLNQYGRPILGDTYIKMPYGPAPSTVLDLIKGQEYLLSPNQLEEMARAVTVTEDNFSSITAKREPELDYFSVSDLKCLQASFDENSDLSFDDLFKATHNEKCYQKSNDGQPIDYALIIDDDNPNREGLLEHIEELSSYVQV